jgi:hypothetical protein
MNIVVVVAVSGNPISTTTINRNIHLLINPLCPVYNNIEGIYLFWQYLANSDSNLQNPNPVFGMVFKSFSNRFVNARSPLPMFPLYHSAYRRQKHIFLWFLPFSLPLSGRAYLSLQSSGVGTLITELQC